MNEQEQKVPFEFRTWVKCSHSARRQLRNLSVISRDKLDFTKKVMSEFSINMSKAMIIADNFYKDQKQKVC